MNKPNHYDLCIDENCERKRCVDRRNPQPPAEASQVAEDDLALAHKYALEVANRFSSVPDDRINRHDITNAAHKAYKVGYAARDRLYTNGDDDLPLDQSCYQAGYKYGKEDAEKREREAIADCLRLAEQISALESERDNFKRVLEWYGSEANWVKDVSYHLPNEYCRAELDEGKRAREALGQSAGEES